MDLGDLEDHERPLFLHPQLAEFYPLRRLCSQPRPEARRLAADLRGAGVEEAWLLDQPELIPQRSIPTLVPGGKIARKFRHGQIIPPIPISNRPVLDVLLPQFYDYRLGYVVAPLSKSGAVAAWDARAIEDDVLMSLPLPSYWLVMVDRWDSLNAVFEGC